MPKISIIIPTFNRANYIKETVESVLNQTYQDFEIIIIDDGSTDNTKKVLDSINDSRISYFYQNNTSVPAVARNIGLKKATGDFIAFLDSDDVWFPCKLEAQLKIFEKYPDVLAVSSNAQFLPQRGLNKYFFVSLFDKRYSFKDFLRSNRVVQSSMLMRHEVVDYIGFLDENYDLRFVEDYEYWLRLVEFRDRSIYLMKEALLFYRIHGANNFTVGDEELKKIKVILKKYEHKYSALLKEVYESRIYITALNEIRREYRTGALGVMKLLSCKNIKIIDKLNIVFKTMGLQMMNYIYGHQEVILQKQKIAFIAYGDIDYLTDYIEHTQNLVNMFDVYLICSQVTLVDPKKVEIIRIKKFSRFRLIDRVYFFSRAWFICFVLKISQAIVLYLRFSFIFGFMAKIYNFFSHHKIKTWYDLRSGSVTGCFDELQNFFYKFESLFFDERIVITKNVGKLIYGKKTNFYVLGIGCNRPRFLIELKKDELMLELGILKTDLVFIYVGTFTNRKLEIFFDSFDLKTGFKILLIGEGDLASTQKISNKIREKGLENNTIFLGRVLYSELYKYYNISHVGIGYIPNVPMYKFQPLTKIYEYAAYGLQIIATTTFANVELEKNIGRFYFLENFDSVSEMNLTKTKIRYDIEKFYWENISINLVQILYNTIS